MLDAIFERFVQQSPVSVMVRGLMERVLNAEQLDSIFDNHARSQYTRELLRIIDGNCLAATDHRLEALKPYAAKAFSY
jgi:hypothetical protein